MMNDRLITLMSDFGVNDVYVGIMKGVMAHINPQLRFVDLSHEIPPQNLMAAQFNLLSAYPFFPAETVHLVVVDPGVGGSRRAIAVELETGFLVGPDNGIFTTVMAQHTVRQVVELTQSRYWRSALPSATFHGRDIFAPVAAHLASRVAIEEVGTPVDPATLVRSPLPACTVTEGRISGMVQYIDRFGNVITNIPGDYIRLHPLLQGDFAPSGARPWSVAIGRLAIPGYHTYSDVPASAPLALIGSHNWVEVAVNGGDAHFQLRLNVGDPVQVNFAVGSEGR